MRILFFDDDENIIITKIDGFAEGVVHRMVDEFKSHFRFTSTTFEGLLWFAHHALTRSELHALCSAFGEITL